MHEKISTDEAQAMACPLAVFALVVAASICAVAGVGMLAGQATGLIAAALFMFVLAGLLLRGVANG